MFSGLSSVCFACCVTWGCRTRGRATGLFAVFQQALLLHPGDQSEVAHTDAYGGPHATRLRSRALAGSEQISPALMPSLIAML